VEFDAEHRSLVRSRTAACSAEAASRNDSACVVFSLQILTFKENGMGRGILLWLLGVPIPVIILLWLFFGR
jgi:hypothetical protein